MQKIKTDNLPIQNFRRQKWGISRLNRGMELRIFINMSRELLNEYIEKKNRRVIMRNLMLRDDLIRAGFARIEFAKYKN